MQAFFTGGSGHVGSAVSPELLEAGHHVVGLARSDTSAAALEALGAKVHRGSLDDLDSLREAATASDGLVDEPRRRGAGNIRALEGVGRWGSATTRRVRNPGT
jgi:uncharacterized protein YbjT (DUF2867 family)